MSAWLTITVQCLISALGLSERDLKQLVPALKIVVPDDPPSPQENLPRGAIARFGEACRRLLSHNSVFSPDGKLIAMDGDERVELRDAKDGTLVRQLCYSHYVHTYAFSVDSKHLAVGQRGAIRIFAVEDGNETARLPIHDVEITALAFNRDGTRLLCGTIDEWVSLWDVTERKLLKKAQFEGGGAITALCFSANGTGIGIGPRNGGARVWDLATWKDVCKLESRRGAVQAIALLPNSDRVLVVTSDHGAWIHELKSGDGITWFPDTGGASAVSADRKMLAATNADPQIDPSIRIFDLQTEKLLTTLRGHAGGATRLLFNPDGKRLHTLGRDGIPRTWNLATGNEIGRQSGHQGEIVGVAFRKGHSQIVSASQDGTVRFWELATRTEKRRLVGVGEYFLGIDCSRDGNVLALLSATRSRGEMMFSDTKTSYRCRFLDPRSEKVYEEGRLEEAGADSLVVSAEGRYLERSVLDNRIRSQVPSGEIIRETSAQNRHAVLSPDGKCVVDLRRPEDDSARIVCRDLPSEQLRFERIVPSANLATVAISPTGNLFAVGGDFWIEKPKRKPMPLGAFCARDIIAQMVVEQPIEAEYHLQIWNLADGSLVRNVIGARRIPLELRFSADGYLLAAADNRGVTVYEAHTGQEYCRFEGYDGKTTAMAFSSDNRLLATGSHDTSILVWDLNFNSEALDVDLDQHDLARCWTELADENPVKARRALWHFINAREAGLRHIAEHLDVAHKADLRRVRGLILQLDAERFEERQSAARELAYIGLAVRPALERAKTESASLEIREAAERLRRAIGLRENAQADSRLRRAIKVIEILQQIDSPESRELLKQIRNDGCYELQRREAK